MTHLTNLAVFAVRPTVLFLVLCFVSSHAYTQSNDELTQTMAKALLLFKAERYAEAAPYFETVVKATPDNKELRFMYGWSLVAKSKQTSDTAEAKRLSAEALVQLEAAKRLGMKEPMLDSLIALLGGASTAPPAGEQPKLTEAEKVLEQAEMQFARSNYDEAIVLYKKALSLDPKMYDAALHLGDAYLAKQDWANSETAYQRAIAIDPEQERAYRYSATPLMKQKKYDEARDRYIEAFITDPYGGMAIRGINQWAQVTGAKLGHPEVDIPKFEYRDGKPTTVMNENSTTAASKAWLAYSLARDAWYKEKFAKAFPKETTYRHSLQEEAESIRSMLASAKEQKLEHPHFVVLQKLDDEGLLESYILLAQADEGIASDHPGYLKANRPKLRQYVLKYVISK